jgi:hypothetical protein
MFNSRPCGRPLAGRVGGLLAIVHAFDEARGAQHVFGHAFAPLAPRLGTGQRVAQPLRGVLQRGRDRRGVLEPTQHLAMLFGAILLELGHEIGDPLQLAGDVLRALLECLCPAVDVLGA